MQSGCEQVEGIYCRRCGYDLRASGACCPECGHAFDRTNLRTYRRRPPLGLLPWLKRIATVALLLASLEGLLIGGFWWGWSAEQPSIAWARQHGNVSFTTTPIGPAFLKKLLWKWDYLRDRVKTVDIISGRFPDTGNFTQDLTPLTRMSQLSRLAIYIPTPSWRPGCSLSRTQMEQIGQLTTLRGLSLAYPGVDRADLPCLRNLRRLESISLEGEFTDADMVHFTAMTRLQSLQLNHATVTDAGLAHLSTLMQLRVLGLPRSKFTGHALASIQRMTQLESFDLSLVERNTLDDQCMAYLENLRKLTQINLHQSQVTDAGLTHLQGMDHLERLSLGQSKVTGTGLQFIKDNVAIWVVGSPISDAGAKWVFKKSSQTWIDLSDTAITDATLAEATKEKRLTGLSLNGTRITNRGIAHLRELPGLQYLCLDRTALTDAALDLMPAANLQILSLNDTPITDAGLERIGRFSNLQSLSLCGTRLTDAGLLRLKQLPKLERLELGRTHITAAGLTPLLAMPNLKNLTLRDCPISLTDLEQLKYDRKRLWIQKE